MKSQKNQSYFLILFFVLAVGFAGCANPYRQNYQSMLGRFTNGASFLMPTPAGTEPQLLTSTDMQSDATSMLENGYFLIGRSSFRSPPINEAEAIDQAKKVGADIVLTKKEYVNTVTESVPMTQWLPDQTTTVSERTAYQATPGAAPAVKTHELTQTVQGESYTTYVSETVDYYNYSATFWKKTKPMKFGVLVQSLDETTKKQLQSNRGVIVNVVVRKTPAYNADILKGDIITLFNSEPIVDADDFFAKIKAHAGQDVIVRIIRNGVTKDIALTLRAANQ